MDFKKFLIAVAIFACPTVYAQETSSVANDDNSKVVTYDEDGFKDLHSTMDAMLNQNGLRWDVIGYSNGSPIAASMRGGLYLSPRVGLEYTYLPKPGTQYPAVSAELGLGYRTKRIDARAYIGIATCRYGELSDKKARYLAPRASVEVLYEVAYDHNNQENFFKIGGELNYRLRRTYIDDETCEFRFTGSYPGVALLLEYERQFMFSRSSITVGARIGTDNEIGNGTKAWGVNAGVYFSYRIGLQKKNL